MRRWLLTFISICVLSGLGYTATDNITIDVVGVASTTIYTTISTTISTTTLTTSPPSSTTTLPPQPETVCPVAYTSQQFLTAPRTSQLRISAKSENVRNILVSCVNATNSAPPCEAKSPVVSCDLYPVSDYNCTLNFTCSDDQYNVTRFSISTRVPAPEVFWLVSSSTHDQLLLTVTSGVYDRVTATLIAPQSPPQYCDLEATAASEMHASQCVYSRDNTSSGEPFDIEVKLCRRYDKDESCNSTIRSNVQFAPACTPILKTTYNSAVRNESSGDLISDAALHVSLQQGDCPLTTDHLLRLSPSIDTPDIVIRYNEIPKEVNYTGLHGSQRYNISVAPFLTKIGARVDGRDALLVGPWLDQSFTSALDATLLTAGTPSRYTLSVLNLNQMEPTARLQLTANVTAEGTCEALCPSINGTEATTAVTTFNETRDCSEHTCNCSFTLRVQPPLRYRNTPEVRWDIYLNNGNNNIQLRTEEDETFSHWNISTPTRSSCPIIEKTKFNMKYKLPTGLFVAWSPVGCHVNPDTTYTVYVNEELCVALQPSSLNQQNCQFRSKWLAGDNVSVVVRPSRETCPPHQLEVNTDVVPLLAYPPVAALRRLAYDDVVVDKNVKQHPVDLAFIVSKDAFNVDVMLQELGFRLTHLSKGGRGKGPGDGGKRQKRQSRGDGDGKGRRGLDEVIEIPRCSSLSFFSNFADLNCGKRRRDVRMMYNSEMNQTTVYIMQAPPGRWLLEMEVCSRLGCLDPPLTLQLTSFARAHGSGDDTTMAVVGGVVAGLLAAAVAVVIFIFARRRYNMPKNMRKSELEYGVNARSMKPSSRPIPISQFPQHTADLHRDTNLGFSNDFCDLADVAKKSPTSVAENCELNRGKNRFTNILAYDHTRVKLSPQPDPQTGQLSDYINANYIPGYSLRREYIATQGPLAGTVDDFWRMIWEQKVPVIVMLTQVVEHGRVRCEKYWPNVLDTCTYGDITVSSRHEQDSGDWRVTEIDVSAVLEDGQVERRTVRHFHYLAWPDFAVTSATTLIRFVKLVRSSSVALQGPVVTHCSAGVGRTGTFIAVDVGLQQVDEEKDLDVFGCLYQMRQHRPNMVQNEDQYTFIYDALTQYITRESERVMDELLSGGVYNPVFDDSDEGVGIDSITTSI